MRLLHLADIHLGASFSAFGDLAAIRADQVREAFRRLPEIAAEVEAHAVLIAGDLFDRPEPPEGVRATARETIRRLVEAGCPVFIVPGNHDPVTYNPNAYREDLGGAHVFRGPRFETKRVETEAGPLHVYGLAYDPAIERSPLTTLRRLEGEGVHVALLHGSIPGAPNWESSPNVLHLPLEELARLHVDYVALGDHHQFRGPDAFRGADVPACYSGSLAAIDLTEIGPHGYVVAELEPGCPAVVTHHDAGVPRVEDVGDLDVTDLESDEVVADAVGTRVPENAVPVVRLIGAPPYPLDPDVVLIHLAERFGWASLHDETRYIDSARLDELAGRDSIVGHVVGLGRSRVQEAEDPPQRRIHERALRVALNALEVD